MSKYIEIPESEVPEHDGLGRPIRFDVPARNQGQIIEIAYGGFGRYEHDDGDPYKRITDRSMAPWEAGAVTWYRRRGR